MKDIKASVLIGNYNNEQYLAECINSIKKQTYQNIEIIIHDDSSLDNSIKKIDKYKNIKIIKNKKKFISNCWPYIPPQSCIALRTEEFKKIFNKINYNLFPDIWMDFRIGLYLKFNKKKFFILDENLTYYRQSEEMISVNFKFLTFAWWIRRKQAHDYVQFQFFFFHKHYRSNYIFSSNDYVLVVIENAQLDFLLLDIFSFIIF